MIIGAAVTGLARSVAMQEVLKEVEQAIARDGGVLLRGEAGTGRDALAHAIHIASDADFGGSVEGLLRPSLPDRPKGRPFVAIDCATARNLEGRLFGTPDLAGANGHRGLDRIAEGCAVHEALDGTLFLKQITEMPGRLQIRLARLLRDREAWVDAKAGASAIAPIALRPIATIEPAAGDERMLPDLRKRLAQTTIDVPMLRNRREDIPALVRCILVEVCVALEIPAKIASSQAMELLAALPWRGNLPELRDVLRALAIRTSGRLIRQSDVLSTVRLDGGPAPFVGVASLKRAREQFEREYVASVLEQHHGRMAAAAKALGLQRANLYRKLRQLAVDRRRPERRDG